MYIKVKASPGAKKESFEEKTPDTFYISVKEPAERNLANGRIVALIAAHFGVAENRVRIVSGHRSRSKILSVDVDSGE